ncbi:MAG TPA: DUF58 domain-containing protein [Steroidobacteraceae bacterium]|nr:DUF58 domain-containing protein [Steroidobacteraceae bacterium]
MEARANSPFSLLRPEVLAGLSTLELVARQAVEGFFQGMHRSPRFGFSQEFAEYKAYAEGDDPRFVDWNVYARTDRTYIRRYQGETNTRLMIALDVSGSMGYSSGPVSKLQYAKYVAASLAYMALHQHDPVGLIAFDSKVRSYRPPSSRTGSLGAILHGLDALTPGSKTDLTESLKQLREHCQRRGLVVVISDLYCEPEALTRAVQPLAYRGHDIMIFQIMDRAEMQPHWDESVLLEDVESGQSLEVSPDYLRTTYRDKLNTHLEHMKKVAGKLGADHVLLVSDEALDKALRGYLMFRKRA